jgi:uncharacterized protein (TIGR00251 family)
LLDGGQIIKFPIKVVPASSQNGIAGWLGDTLKIRVTAPPERGKANAAAAAIIAELLGIAIADVRVVAGPGSARKIVEIDGLSASEVHRRLSGVTSE